MGPSYTEAELDEAIERWHAGDGARLELHEYLGWTWEQYINWIQRGIIP